MEFTSADIFQHSPLGNVLNSLKYLSLSGDSWPNYVRLEWEADDEEILSPPTTHLIATVDDLTDMLDFDSEDIDGMDDDAGEEQEPPLMGRWTTTSSYDIYMEDTLKQSMGVVGAAPSPATAIPAQETKTIRMVPKRNTTPTSLLSSRPNRRRTDIRRRTT